MMVVAETLKQLHFPFYFLGSVSPEILFFRLRRWRWCSPALALPCMLLLSIWHTVLKRSKGYKWFAKVRVSCVSSIFLHSTLHLEK